MKLSIVLRVTLAALAVLTLAAFPVQGAQAASPTATAARAWYLRNFNSGGVANVGYTYGLPGDKPIVGDWNGDGIDTPGVVRGNTWYLRNSNTSGVADIVFTYGLPTDKPIVGDWNGDGIDTPGVVRGS
ncbi:MAG: hypothetical protein JST60_18430, partial [Chloroflexi bacterium SZAS-1]|nr:hypothetical protein [Chloroflexi bacterium SZAS-1]